MKERWLAELEDEDLAMLTAAMSYLRLSSGTILQPSAKPHADDIHQRLVREMQQRNRAAAPPAQTSEP